MTHTVSLKDFRSLSVSFSKITNRFHDFDKKSLTKAKLLLPKVIHLFAKLTQSCKTLRNQAMGGLWGTCTRHIQVKYLQLCLINANNN